MPASALTMILAAVAIIAIVIAIMQSMRLRTAREHLAAVTTQRDTRSDQHDAESREQAAAAERERIYSDLHDDLGAKLLTLIYQSESPLQADLARSILQDLRDVVTRSRGTPGTLADVLADLRSEAAQRLAAVDIGLVWDVPDDLPDPALDTGRALHLHRIVREAISNVVRHAQAHRLRVRVRVAGDQLRLELTDDGSGAAVGAAATGSGMRNMRVRAAELAGDIRWTPGTEGGTKVLLAMPLPRESDPVSP
jgi:signal transduction histidine kinase